jgi:hypothetical protein
MELFRQAQELGRAHEQRVANLERDVLEKKAKLQEAEAKLKTENSAPHREAVFQAELNGIPQCPNCWVVHGIQTPMDEMPNDGGHEDFYQCPTCHHSVLA